MRESRREYRIIIDYDLCSISCMREILVDFARYDAGPTYWNPPDMLYVEANLSADLVDEFNQQCEWMRRIALDHFREEQVTQQNFFEMRGHVLVAYPETKTIPFCGSSIELMLKLGVCRRGMVTPRSPGSTVILQFRKPSDLDDYKRAGRQCPPVLVEDYSVYAHAYVQTALWRDLALHAERQSRGGDKENGWKYDCPTRQYLRKLWTMWAACIRALQREFVISLLICESGVIPDAPRLVEPHNVLCILVWEQAIHL